MSQDSFGGSGLAFDQPLCRLAHPAPAVGVVEKLQADPSELLPVADLNCGARFQEQTGDVAEVLHVRPERNGLAGECRLEQVVAAGGNEAAAYKDDVRQLEDSRQLADRVEQENLRRLELRRQFLVGGFESRTTNEAQPRAREQLSDRFKTGRMARGEDQQRSWMRTADLFPRFQDQRLFARHGTRRYHDGT